MVFLLGGVENNFHNTAIFKATYQCYLKNNFGEYFSNNPLPLAAVLQMIVEKDTVMIKAAHVGQLLFHKKEKVWQRERIKYTQHIVHHVS